MAIFVDTGAWYAASVPSDADHAAAKAFIASNAEAFLTSDYVYDELLTLFRSRGLLNRAKDWVEKLRTERCDIVRVTPDDVERATAIFFQFAERSGASRTARASF